MLKQSELNEQEQAEVFRRADELFRAESEQARTARSAAAAAEELGIPQEYLDRAAAQVHAERVEKIRASRRRRNLVVALAAGLGLGGGVALLSLRPGPPPAAVAISQSALEPIVNDLSDATVSAADGSLTINVRSFLPDARGDYFANARLSAPENVGAYKKVSFDVQGSGLSNIRLDLEGDGVRWRGPNRPVSAGRVTVQLRDFTRQEKSGSGWRNVSWRAPHEARSLSFKTGETVNPATATGSVTIRNIRFE